MNAPLVFLDTETTGLSLEDDIWEFAAIRRKTDGTESDHHLLIEHDDAKCRELPKLFRRDHELRYHSATDMGARPAASRKTAAGIISALMVDRPHIVGAVPNFDTERIALLLREFGYEPNWHYHLIDVENLAVGYLAAKGVQSELPWDSDVLSLRIGVKPPGDERHTAMGDARWAMRIYDHVMGGAS